MLKSIVHWFSRMERYLSDPVCVFCGKKKNAPPSDYLFSGQHPLTSRLAENNRICFSCLHLAGVLEPPVCKRCGKRLENKGEERCGECRRERNSSIVCNRSCFDYNERMKEWVSLYKYRGKLRLERAFAEAMTAAARYYYKGVPFDMVTYVPLHSKRLQERGFNQAERLAEIVSQQLSVPLSHALERVVDTPKQSRQSRRERFRSIHGAFVVNGAEMKRFAARDPKRMKRLYKRDSGLLLIDDVYTTGATTEECCRVLRNFGISRSYVLTLCRS